MKAILIKSLINHFFRNNLPPTFTINDNLFLPSNSIYQKGKANFSDESQVTFSAIYFSHCYFKLYSTNRFTAQMHSLSQHCI
jgi:hypothetical protein